MWTYNASTTTKKTIKTKKQFSNLLVGDVSLWPGTLPFSCPVLSTKSGRLQKIRYLNTAKPKAKWKITRPTQHYGKDVNCPKNKLLSRFGQITYHHQERDNKKGKTKNPVLYEILPFQPAGFSFSHFLLYINYTLTYTF